MPRCDGGGGLLTYIAIYLFHSSIRSIDKKNVFGEPYLNEVAVEVSVRAR
jgi:hypothetical protein